MGNILDGVKSFINQNRIDSDWLNIFLSAFSVTRANKHTALNSTHYDFFLSPDDHVKNMYGFSKEILLVYAPYEKMEARTLRVIEGIFNTEPAKSRVEQINFILVSNCENIKDWINNNVNPEDSRIIIAFNTKELLQNSFDNWYVRNKMYEQYFSRDLFDMTLPIKDGSYFFGRQKIVGSYVDAIKKSENRGLFGLRKTGKTSLLFRIESTLKLEDDFKIFFFDCKSPAIRKLRWFQLIEKLSNEIIDSLDITIKKKFTEIEAADTFNKLIQRVNEKMPNIKIVLFFDEIEFISFKAIQDKHWLNDYIDFWQTIWSAQSICKNLSFVICGVNPSTIEKDMVNQIQNPLFGIVSYEYLKGLSVQEILDMINSLGKKMGVKFSENSVQAIHERYGGHPLLTRKACSWINKQSQLIDEKRPITFELDRINKHQDQLDNELSFYCGHIVSEIKDFYPEEYEMLELLASGQISDFIELSLMDTFIKHLKDYGLLTYENSSVPKISIPVLTKYIGLELAKREKRTTITKLVSFENRDLWVKKRIDKIIYDFRFLERLIKSSQLPLIFGFNSFPEAEKLLSIKANNEIENYNEFLNTLNKCFVESIEKYGDSINNQKYFFTTIKTQYSSLFNVLRKIRVYRNNSFHLDLLPNVDKAYLEFLEYDLEGRKPNQVEDVCFLLMQKILDELFTALQVEINKLS